MNSKNMKNQNKFLLINKKEIQNRKYHKRQVNLGITGIQEILNNVQNTYFAQCYTYIV